MFLAICDGKLAICDDKLAFCTPEECDAYCDLCTDPDRTPCAITVDVTGIGLEPTETRCPDCDFMNRAYEIITTSTPTQPNCQWQQTFIVDNVCGTIHSVVFVRVLLYTGVDGIYIEGHFDYRIDLTNPNEQVLSGITVFRKIAELGQTVDCETLQITLDQDDTFFTDPGADLGIGCTLFRPIADITLAIDFTTPGIF